MLASRVLQPGRWTLVVTILRCILNKQFYEASGSPVVILGASGPVLLSCHSRFARKPRFSARPCSSRSHSCHLPFAQQHRTLGSRRRSAAPTPVAIRFWLVRILRLVGAGSHLLVLYPRLARHHSARLVCFALSRSRPFWQYSIPVPCDAPMRKIVMPDRWSQRRSASGVGLEVEGLLWSLVRRGSDPSSGPAP